MGLRNLTVYGLGSMRGINLPAGLPVANIPSDDFETYADGAAANNLNGGTNGNHLFTISWTGAYVDRGNFQGLISSDDMESYSDAAAVNGLNSQTSTDRGSFSAGYVDNVNFQGLISSDDMESYVDGASVNGLNSQTSTDRGSFSAGYVAN